MGGGKLLVASEQTERFALLITLSGSGDIANCLRANGGLNATDNALVEYARQGNSSW